MNILIYKTYTYADVMDDPRFSYQVAFRRLNGVREMARSLLPAAKTVIILPDEEMEAAQRHLELGVADQLVSASNRRLALDGLADAQPLLVLDEQAIYASRELIETVLSRYAGRPSSWDDPEKLLWSYNYHDSCRFFVAPAAQVRKHLAASAHFLQLQQQVLADGADLYPLTSCDLPAIFGQAARYNPYPYHYYLEPTSRCNSNCIMCPFHSTDPKIAQGRLHIGDGGDDMPLELFKSLVDEVVGRPWSYLPEYRLPMITAQLRGEPTLAPNCREMFRYVKEKGARLSFTTNGSVLHQDNLAEFLLDIGLDEIIVSIDGDRQEYERIRPALDYQQVLHNLTDLRRLRDVRGSSTPTIYTKRILLDKDISELDDSYRDKIGDIADYLGFGYENFDDFKTESKGFSRYFFEVEEAKRLPCILASDVTVVKSNGKVDMCFGAAEHYIGDTHRESLLSILANSPLRAQIIQNQANGSFGQPDFCESCTSWKANYHRYSIRDGFSVDENPILSYWKKLPPQQPVEHAPAGLGSFLKKLLARVAG